MLVRFSGLHAASVEKHHSPLYFYGGIKYVGKSNRREIFTAFRGKEHKKWIKKTCKNCWNKLPAEA